MKIFLKKLQSAKLFQSTLYEVIRWGNPAVLFEFQLARRILCFAFCDPIDKPRNIVFIGYPKAALVCILCGAAATVF